MDDLAIVAWQLGREPRAFRRVACRCRHGYPAVTEQAPRAFDGEPFPTTFWLTCPFLGAAVARIEAAGGVRRISEEVAGDPALRESLERGDAEQRRLRPELPGGIGGRSGGTHLKCLHAHVAFALARPGYELGEKIAAEAGEPWCDDARCRPGAGPAGARAEGGVS